MSCKVKFPFRDDKKWGKKSVEKKAVIRKESSGKSGNQALGMKVNDNLKP